MGTGSQTLRYAVRIKVIGKYLGQLGFMLALLSLVPFIVSLYFAEYTSSVAYAMVIGLLFLLAAASRYLPTPSHLQQNEALAIVAMTFLLAPLLMSLPLSATGIPWRNALFESISAITTTGLSALQEPERLSPTLLFSRAWMQWYGGLGIVVLSIALLHGHHIAIRRLAEPPSEEGLASTTRTYARRILLVYLLFTLIAVAILRLVGLDNFGAIAHALSAISTGGFSTYGNSLQHFTGLAAPLSVILIGLYGAVPLHLYYQARRHGVRTSLQDVELRTLLLATLLVSAVLAWLFHNHGMPWHEAWFHAAIQGISAQSTSGFSSLPIDSLDGGSKLVLILSMFLGGGVGSTAGGVKLLRLLILLRLIQLLLQRSAMPEHAVVKAKIAGRPLEQEDIQSALMLILLFTTVIVLSWLPFIAYGYAPLDALFEVVSASATVGLSSGISGPELEPALQLVLAFDMLLGRLEIVALLVLLYPPTWFSKRV